MDPKYRIWQEVYVDWKKEVISNIFFLGIAYIYNLQDKFWSVLESEISLPPTNTDE